MARVTHRSAAVVLAVVLSLGTGLDRLSADTLEPPSFVWRLLGVSPDGGTLATLAVALDPERGFHCYRSVTLDAKSGAEIEMRPLVTPERRTALAARGDYDLLAYEQDLARGRWLEILLDEGFFSCRPAALHSAHQVEGERDGPVGDGRAVVARWPRKTAHLSVLGEPGEELLEVQLGGPERPAAVVGPIDFGALSPSPLVSHRYRVGRVLDVFDCGSDKFVVIVESDVPPHRELPVRQLLIPLGSPSAHSAPHSSRSAR